jgi:hypothetical protein
MSEFEGRVTEIEEKVSSLDQILGQIISHHQEQITTLVESNTKTLEMVTQLAAENAALSQGLLWTGSILEKVLKVVPEGVFGSIYETIVENLDVEMQEHASRVLNNLAHWKSL